MTTEQIVLPVVLALLSTCIFELVLRPLFKWLWVRAQIPSPLSLQDKVRLADQLTQNKNYLAYVAHMSDHPGDLFLRLFRYALGIFLSFVAAQALFVLRSRFDNDVSPVIG